MKTLAMAVAIATSLMTLFTTADPPVGSAYILKCAVNGSTWIKSPYPVQWDEGNERYDYDGDVRKVNEPEVYWTFGFKLKTSTEDDSIPDYFHEKPYAASNWVKTREGSNGYVTTHAYIDWEVTTEGN